MAKTVNLGPVTAYGIAVKNGFVGTEEEWIESLKYLGATSWDELLNKPVNKEVDENDVVTYTMNGCLTLQGDPTSELHAVTKQYVDQISKRIDDMQYVAIVINSFSASPTAEMGSTVYSITLSWSINKAPATLTLDGESLDVFAAKGTKVLSSETGWTMDSEKLSWVLKATDERDASSYKTAYLTFYNRVYYGTAANPETINSDFVTSLANKPLTGSRARTVTYNAATGEYMWYCVPARLKECTFVDTATNLTGGFGLVDTIAVTNDSGFEEDYYMYRSDNAVPGSTTMKIT